MPFPSSPSTECPSRAKMHSPGHVNNKPRANTYPPDSSTDSRFRKNDIFKPGNTVCLRDHESCRIMGFTNPDNIDTHIFGHPAVVLADLGEDVRIAITTSFLGCEFKSKSNVIQQQHIPIHDNDRHPYTGELLMLEGGKMRKKETWLKLHETWVFPKLYFFTKTDTVLRTQICLTESSLKYVLRAVDEYANLSKGRKENGLIESKRPFKDIPEVLTSQSPPLCMVPPLTSSNAILDEQSPPSSSDSSRKTVSTSPTTPSKSPVHGVKRAPLSPDSPPIPKKPLQESKSAENRRPAGKIWRNQRPPPRYPPSLNWRQEPRENHYAPPRYPPSPSKRQQESRGDHWSLPRSQSSSTNWRQDSAPDRFWWPLPSQQEFPSTPVRRRRW